MAPASIACSLSHHITLEEFVCIVKPVAVAMLAGATDVKEGGKCFFKKNCCCARIWVFGMCSLLFAFVGICEVEGLGTNPRSGGIATLSTQRPSETVLPLIHS